MKHVCHYHTNRQLPLQPMPTPLQETSALISPSQTTLSFVYTFLMSVQFGQRDLYQKKIFFRTPEDLQLFLCGKQGNKEPGKVNKKPGANDREHRFFQSHAPSSIHCSHPRDSLQPSTQSLCNLAAA